jgi:hypothetical protein
MKQLDFFSWEVLNFLICSALTFLTAPLHAQEAGDAIEFISGSYFSLSLPVDSLNVCTIELWVNPTKNLDAISLLTIGETDSTGFGLYSTTLAGAPEEYAEIKLGGVMESVTGNQAHLPLNTWTHLAMTRNGAVWTLYKNGVLVGRGKRQAKINSGSTRIGKGLTGLMDEIRIWKRELTQDEIRSSLSTSLQGDEKDLLVYFTMDKPYRSGDTLLINKVHGWSSTNASVVLSSSPPLFLLSTLALYQSPQPKFTMKSFPNHMQFLSRMPNRYAKIHCDGSIDDIGYDSIILIKLRNDIVVIRQSVSLNYLGTTAQFHFLDSIYAERSQYTFSLSVKTGSSERFLTEACDLVSGDAFFIAGQSNAHPTVDWYSNVSPYSRTFGFQTDNLNLDDYDPADTSWGYGNAHGFGDFFSGPYVVGVWASHMEAHILDDFGIPTCIINGAAGGSTVVQNLPDSVARESLGSIYGRALYRSQKSGLQKNYRAIFWYQGEYNSVDGYYDAFKTLYNAWLQDYSNGIDSTLKKIYVFQVRPGCVPGERVKLRELQRTLSDSLPNIEVMSTCGITGHSGCHFDAFGYWHIADNIYRLVSRDLYGSLDTVDIYPPNISTAFYGNKSRDIIILRFADVTELSITPDTLVLGKLQQLKDYLYLDKGKINSILVRGDSLILVLPSSSDAKSITYLPDETYNDYDIVYEGPWIMNKRGVGAFSFANIPIAPYSPDTTTSDIVSRTGHPSSLLCAPNPITNFVTLIFTTSGKTEVQFDIIDFLGKKILSLGKKKADLGVNIISYDLSSLSAGGYILRMISGNEVVVKKIILFK